jgi:hypothetical protein
MIKELQFIYDRLEELLSVEKLKYHNKNWLAFDDKKINEEIQSAYSYLMKQIENLKIENVSYPRFLIFHTHHDRQDPFILLQISDAHVIPMSVHACDKVTQVGKLYNVNDFQMTSFQPFTGKIEHISTIKKIEKEKN